MYPKHEVLEQEIREVLVASGADVVGFAAVADLALGPSERFSLHMADPVDSVFERTSTTGLAPGAVFWEPDARTAVVFGIEHPASEPELDWWHGPVNPPGNRILMRIARELAEHLRAQWPDISVYPKPYHILKGGIYLKDAAVCAGLGCIGRNNLLITPEFGPRVRLRSVLIGAQLPSTGPIDFDPCATCDGRCTMRCPARAFERRARLELDAGPTELPARDGSYSRSACMVEMDRNVTAGKAQGAPDSSDESEPIIKYCRICEFDCPVGRA